MTPCGRQQRCCCSMSTATTIFRHWLVKSAWPGMGLFGESYVLFSIGTLTPLWQQLYPDCYFGEKVCRPALLQSLTYSVVAGVIVGMLGIGYAANSMGRRKGSLLTASLMFGGAASMVLESFVWADHVVTLFRSMAISLFVFGIGVGGEYPLSSSLASENASSSPHNITSHSAGGDKNASLLQSSDNTNDDNDNNNNRGRQIQLVFAMQGMGIWFNSLTLLILLWVTGQKNNTQDDNDYDSETLLIIWRITYSIGALILLVVLVTRYLFLEESKVWEQDRMLQRQTRQDKCAGVIREDESMDPALPPVDALDNSLQHPAQQPRGASPTPGILTQASTISELSFPTVIMHPSDGMERDAGADGMPQHKYSTSLLGNYGGRLFGASTAWLLWDISFYGNKLFQATFLLALTGEDTTLLEFAMAATINSTVALLGYFGAAWLVDNPSVGHVRLQTLGFVATGMLFLACGFLFDVLSSGWLVTLYLACSFVGQLGPNATTFLIPAEIFPTEQRTYCHGIAAASGKVGALIAAVLFHFVSGDADLFLLCGYTSFAACFITSFFIPEMSGLDLAEVDKQWRMAKDGQRHVYRGPANDAKHMSLYECQRHDVSKSMPH